MKVAERDGDGELYRISDRPLNWQYPHTRPALLLPWRSSLGYLNVLHAAAAPPQSDQDDEGALVEALDSQGMDAPISGQIDEPVEALSQEELALWEEQVGHSMKFSI